VALAKASGSLIAVLALDLFEESFKAGGIWFSGIGLLGGAASLVAADGLLDRYIEEVEGSVSSFALLAAVTLDGVPGCHLRLELARGFRRSGGDTRPAPYWRLRDPRLGSHRPAPGYGYLGGRQ
jgi:hypothetical protein